jgi:hypothetical protein
VGPTDTLVGGGGIQVEKVTTASQRMSSNAWI